MAGKYFEGVGRRKTSTARVRVFEGNGTITVNQRSLEAYFTRPGDIQEILSPLDVVGENKANYDISVLVKGGGVTGQRDAVVLGLSRALLLMNPDSRKYLKAKKLLTVDPRAKERKKPGLKKARKAPTYTKR